MKNLVKKALPLIDILAVPLVYPAALLMKGLRRAGVHRMPLCRDALIRSGVFPIINHYYEPRFNYKALKSPLSQDRYLPGIDWNIDGQLEFLSKLVFSDELQEFPIPEKGMPGYRGVNESFAPGDAEYWYQIIRALKPSRIFEVGSGNSTLVATLATQTNSKLDPNYHCKHVCIEPYEMPWLEQAGVIVIREKVEDVGLGIFAELGKDDILFIDSSHIIRPQGDVLFEYLELLPSLRPGVIVHIHDIFSPKDYLSEWIENRIKFWNEQYLLEAFLSDNKKWRIIGALNFLSNHHRSALKNVSPFMMPEHTPGSFYIQKVS